MDYVEKPLHLRSCGLKPALQARAAITEMIDMKPLNQNEIIQIIADVLGVPPAQITPATTSADIEGWDSVQHLNLVLALEEASGKSFAPEEMESMTSVAEILRALQ